MDQSRLTFLIWKLIDYLEIKSIKTIEEIRNSSGS